MTKNNKQKKGFTLIELLVVIAIIAILAAVVIASTGSARAKARDAKRVSDLEAIATALGMYYSNNNAYPEGENATGIGVLVTSGLLATAPTDPLGGSYVYKKCQVGGIDRFVVAAELEVDKTTADSDGNGTICSTINCNNGDINTAVSTGYAYCISR